MDKKGAKGYWISTAKIINQELFDEYVNKVAPWLKEVGGEVFAKDTEPLGKDELRILIQLLFVNFLP